MFIPRVWSDEVERIGKQRCSPRAYKLQGIGDGIGFIGLLNLLGLPFYLAYTVLTGTFRWSLLWLFMLPFVLGIIGSVIVGYSWAKVYRKGFRYDYQQRMATWTEDGRNQAFTYANLEGALGTKGTDKPR